MGNDPHQWAFADDDPLWTFALAVYDTPGIPDACLALQDEAGVDVPLLLFAAWAARRGQTVDTSWLAAQESRIADWRDRTVRPLRAIRRAMKGAQPPDPRLTGAAEALRTRIKDAELEAERLELKALASVSGLEATGPTDLPADTAAVRTALEAAISLAGADFTRSWQTPLCDALTVAVVTAPA